jgi:hypothetical protein
MNGASLEGEDIGEKTEALQACSPSQGKTVETGSTEQCPESSRSEWSKWNSLEGDRSATLEP